MDVVCVSLIVLLIYSSAGNLCMCSWTSNQIGIMWRLVLRPTTIVQTLRPSRYLPLTPLLYLVVFCLKWSIGVGKLQIVLKYCMEYWSWIELKKQLFLWSICFLRKECSYYRSLFNIRQTPWLLLWGQWFLVLKSHSPLDHIWFWSKNTISQKSATLDVW